MSSTFRQTRIAPCRRTGGAGLLMSRPVTALLRCAGAIAAAAIVSCGPRTVGDGQIHTAAPILADYDMEIREQTARADGIRHVDTPATIRMLRQAHVTTYFYLMLHAPTDWADFVSEFLPAAERAGIDVWVYLVPPTECCSKPFERDFVRWAAEIARLSLVHQNLSGWAMDDFGSNLATFTPEYTKAMQTAAHAINPELQFFPVLYHRDYRREFLEAYASHFDGAIFPYNIDLNEFAALDSTLTQTARALEPFGLRLILMVYATKLSVAEYPPSATYVAGALRVGIDSMQRGETLGVVTYAMAKEFQREDCGFDRHLNLTMPSETPTAAGDFVLASQTVRLDPRAASYRLRFFEQDSYPVGTAGYHFKQLLVNGRTVWDVDVASDAALSWVERSFDVTAYVTGRSTATFAFRLYDKKAVTNFGVRMSIAGIDASGISLDNGDVRVKTGWTFATRGPGAARYADRACDPDRQQHVYEAVRELYGRVITGDFKR